VVLLLSLSACQYDPYTYSYARSKPHLREMIGHWVATDDTLRGFTGGPYEKAHPTIDVLEDGSIRMNDIPDTWQADFGEGKAGLNRLLERGDATGIRTAGGGCHLAVETGAAPAA
jgi:hypothetical protein